MSIKQLMDLMDLVLGYGTAPALLFIAYLLWSWRKGMDTQLEQVNQKISGQGKKLASLEEDQEKFKEEAMMTFAKQGEVLGMFSGWRGEIQQLSGKVDKLLEEFHYLRGRYDEWRKTT